MDIVKPKKQVPFYLHRLFWLVGGVMLFSVALIFVSQNANQVTLSKKGLLITSVKRGDINITVSGYGALTTDKLQLLTTYSRGTVKELVLKPGARVTKDSVVVRIENPELEQIRDNAAQQLSQAQANLRQLKVNQQREILQERAILSELEARHETALLKKSAEEKLVEQGIVSELTYKESVLNERQLAHRILLFKERNTQLKSVHQEAIYIAQDRVKQHQGLLSVAQDRLEKLTIRAGIDGVLQRLSVSLGQSLNAGQEIALIGSTSELIALVKVPQSQASLVNLGQKALVDTRLDIVSGFVSRIDPIVSNNTVEVEISLPEQLPISARLQQSVDAKIISKTLQNVLYMQRPANIQPNNKLAYYRIDDSGNSALKSTLLFGEKAGQYIEIKEGASEHDAMIISDLSNYNVAEIALN